MSLTPKNWAAFQHYKDRSPAWIKLHRGLLDDFAFSRLPVASRALAPLLWLLASEYEGGKISGSLEEIAFRLHVSEDELTAALKPLIEGGFFADDSNMLAMCKQVAIPEERREEEEIQEETEEEENYPSLRSGEHKIARETFDDDWPKDYREQFWERYPRKKSKKDAFKALNVVRKSREVTFARLLAAVDQIPRHDATFIPYPASWLRDGGWMDVNTTESRAPPQREREPTFLEIAAEIRNNANARTLSDDHPATPAEPEILGPVRSYG